MATAAPNPNLPLFYNALEPLNANQHGKFKRVRHLSRECLEIERRCVQLKAARSVQWWSWQFEEDKLGIWRVSVVLIVEREASVAANLLTERLG